MLRVWGLGSVQASAIIVDLGERSEAHWMQLDGPPSP